MLASYNAVSPTYYRQNPYQNFSELDKNGPKWLISDQFDDEYFRY